MVGEFKIIYPFFYPEKTKIRNFSKTPLLTDPLEKLAKISSPVENCTQNFVPAENDIFFIPTEFSDLKFNSNNPFYIDFLGVPTSTPLYH